MGLTQVFAVSPYALLWEEGRLSQELAGHTSGVLDSALMAAEPIAPWKEVVGIWGLFPNPSHSPG